MVGTYRGVCYITLHPEWEPPSTRDRQYYACIEDVECGFYEETPAYQTEGEAERAIKKLIDAHLDKKVDGKSVGRKAQADPYADERFGILRDDLKSMYTSAEADMRKKFELTYDEYVKQCKEWERLVAAGDMTETEYAELRRVAAMDPNFAYSMAEMLASDAAAVDQRAMEAIKDMLPCVYAESANGSAYGIDSVLGKDHSFDLYDQSTVRRLERESDKRLLPAPRVDAAKDTAWNTKKFNSCITQSILQGESVEKAAARLHNVVGMDERAALRAARTAMTAAENAGRVDSYRRAKALGIDLEMEWWAVHDARTRFSHMMLDGQRVPVDGKFKIDDVELEYPGDPTAPPAYVYNCRCTVVPWLEGVDEEDPQRWENMPEGMTYDEWKNGKIAAKSSGAATTEPPKEKQGTVPWTEYDLHVTDDNWQNAIEMGDAQIENLDYDDIGLLMTYTTDEYQGINEYKRTGSISGLESLSRYDINSLDAILEEARTDRDIFALRGTTGDDAIKELLSRSGNESAFDDPSVLVGQVWYDDAYLSTTVDRYVAESVYGPEGLHGGFGTSGSGGVIFHIYAPEGANAIYLESISEAPQERELLFRGHQEMVITHAECKDGGSGSKQWDIWMEAVVDRVGESSL